MTFKEKMIEILKSRKFQVTATASLSALVGGISTGQPYLTIAIATIAPWLVWVLAQAKVDAAKVSGAARQLADKVDESMQKLPPDEAQEAVEAAFLKYSDDLKNK